MSHKIYNQKFNNNDGDTFIVLPIKPERKYDGKSYHFYVQFEDTGYQTTASASAIKSGMVKDRLKPIVYGVGALGYASNKGNKKMYNRWYHMLARCYDITHKSYSLYGGSGVKVCKRWHRFDYFLEDVSQIEGYELESIDNLFLDKDIKQQNISKSERIYSLETCKWVTHSENDSHREQKKEFPELRKSFVAIGPNGNKYEVNGVRAFAEEHKLNASAISQCIKGNWKSHKGWKFEKMEENIND